MTYHHSIGPETAELYRRYADARARLFNGRPQATHTPPRRVIRLSPQSHRPDYVIPKQAPLPMVSVAPATLKRVRDIIVVAQEQRGTVADGTRWLDILDEVCAKHGMTRAQVLSVRRAVPIVAARHEAMYRLSKETSMSLPAIGRRMGGKDHTTVLHAIRRHEAKIRGEVYVMPRYGAALEAAAP